MQNHFYKTIVKLALFNLLFLSLSSCALWNSIQEELAKPDPNNIVVEKPKTDQEILFDKAVEFEKTGQPDLALKAYYNLTRDVADQGDELYDRSLLNLALLYERNDQSEKAVLALNELFKRNTTVISLTSLRLIMIRNHYRVTNYYQAQKIRSEIDQDYKISKINISDLFEGLFNHTQVIGDHRVLDEMLYLGDIQKYFIFVMESGTPEQAEKSSDLLKLYYENMISLLQRPTLNTEVKNKLVISLLDQLGRFERYKITENQELEALSKFNEFAESKKKFLTERLANGNFNR